MSHDTSGYMGSIQDGEVYVGKACCTNGLMMRKFMNQPTKSGGRLFRDENGRNLR